ncbi:hypothetical protein GE09DRAFT_1139413 [Coniochaeta sp. 2T2.1]|nr:hypothetical protein GE09DRAFT_1139413 [Coniochaeta sp. 2T2.1]
MTSVMRGQWRSSCRTGLCFVFSSLLCVVALSLVLRQGCLVPYSSRERPRWHLVGVISSTQTLALQDANEPW